MTKLVWDQIGERSYENGIDRGVFYPSVGPGVPWNGLLSVSESPSGGDQKSVSLDGVTFTNAIGLRDYKAVVKAFSAPREFSPCVGDLEIIPGFTITKQPKVQFSFSYRTLIQPVGYKLHLIYNVLATPTSRSYESTNDTSTPMNLEWAITATPINFGVGYRPSAHYVFDSNKVDVAVLEDILYGTSSTDPALPPIDEIIGSVYV